MCLIWLKPKLFINKKKWLPNVNVYRDLYKHKQVCSAHVNKDTKNPTNHIIIETFEIRLLFISSWKFGYNVIMTYSWDYIITQYLSIYRSGTVCLFFKLSIDNVKNKYLIHTNFCYLGLCLSFLSYNNNILKERRPNKSNLFFDQCYLH